MTIDNECRRAPMILHPHHLVGCSAAEFRHRQTYPSRVRPGRVGCAELARSVPSTTRPHPELAAKSIVAQLSKLEALR